MVWLSNIKAMQWKKSLQTISNGLEIIWKQYLMKQNISRCILSNCIIGSSRLPTKVNKNFSIDLAEVGSGGKNSSSPREVHTQNSILFTHFWTSQAQLFIGHIRYKRAIFRSAGH